MKGLSIKEIFVSLIKKKAVKNGIWMYALQFFNTIVPLLTLPYITRILGSSEYGKFTIALNMLGYFQVVVEYGFGMSATRKVALEEDGLDIHKLFSAVVYSRGILFFVCCAFTGVYTLCNMRHLEQCVCLMILMVGLLGNCIQLNWLFQGKQDMKFISAISIISRTISVICIFCFVKKASDLYLYALLYTISPFMNGLLGLAIARFKYQLQLKKVSLQDILSEMKQGWFVFTTQLSSKVFGAIGITFLGIFAVSSEVGVYSAVQKIPNIMLLAWAPIGQVIYPISSKKMLHSFSEGKKYIFKLRKIIMPFFIIGAIIIAIFSKQVVHILFGAEFAAFAYWTIPLLIWLLLSINNNFLGVQVLLGSGHDKEYSKCFQVGVILTIVFNFLLIYFFKGNGAAIAPALSETMLALMIINQIHKIERKEIIK
ncbi:flippase [bacterium]|nr:flippase [bacterium]MDY4503929.1 flippase [Bariatricus sp.]